MATNGPINGASRISSETVNNSTATRSERELCKYFMNGVCRFGNNCFYSHDRSSRPSTVCRYYLIGTCSYGDRCFYDHVRPKDQTSNQNQSTTNTQTSSSNEASDNINARLVTRLTNRPKLLTTLQSSGVDSAESNASSSNHNNNSNNVMPGTSAATSYYEALTGSKPNPISSEQFNQDLSIFDENYIDYLNLKAARGANTPSLCPIYEKTLACPFLETGGCEFMHGNVCDICNTACLNPYDEKQSEEHRHECMKLMEKDMEEAFAAQRSAQKVCGICMEIVWEKENDVDKRFGILENCNHVFCLTCIRKWRASKSYENKIVKACPECRVKSDFITPNRFWFEDDENKKKIIEEYKCKLSKTACKYFKQGDGRCPFGNKCFYLHQYRDGRIADLPAPTKRHRLNRDGNLEAFSNIVRIDFDFSDDEEDDFDILEFFRHSLLWDTETDSDFSDLFELSDEFLI